MTSWDDVAVVGVCDETGEIVCRIYLMWNRKARHKGIIDSYGDLREKIWNNKCLMTLKK
jgi:hypothetical protein